jgi:hypothetical protein
MHVRIHFLRHFELRAVSSVFDNSPVRRGPGRGGNAGSITITGDRIALLRSATITPPLAERHPGMMVLMRIAARGARLGPTPAKLAMPFFFRG